VGCCRTYRRVGVSAYGKLPAQSSSSSSSKAFRPERLEYLRFEPWGISVRSGRNTPSQSRTRTTTRTRTIALGVDRLFVVLSPQRGQDLGAIRTTQARRCIPSGAGAERAVIPGNNIPEGRWILVQSRVDEPDP
jgi:hypothetical protein